MRTLKSPSDERVELALALLQHRNDFPFDDRLEVWRFTVRRQRCVGFILLVQEKNIRVRLGATALVEHASAD